MLNNFFMLAMLALIADNVTQQEQIVISKVINTYYSNELDDGSNIDDSYETNEYVEVKKIDIIEHSNNSSQINELDASYNQTDALYNNGTEIIGYYDETSIISSENITIFDDDDDYKEAVANIKGIENKIKESTLDAFKAGNEFFSVSYLNEVMSLNQGRSVILSPFSILYLLAQLALYTKGASRDQLNQALNLYNDFQIRLVFSELTDAINAINREGYEQLVVAARTYVTEKYNLSASFLLDTKTVFGAEAETIDFEQPGAAADTINLWVQNKTNNVIKNLVSPGMFNPDTVLVLVDAIYFKGDWLKKFNAFNTQNRDFYIDEETTIEIPTMYQRNTFYYKKDTEHVFEIISLPFEGGKFSLNIVLPDKNSSLDALLNTLQDTTILSNAFQSLENVLVDLYLPKIEISGELDIKKTLERVGITDIFTDNSGIEGILQKPKTLSVSSGTQKAALKVNENGAEAAAASAVIEVGLTAVRTSQPPLVFRADHPFAYFLVYSNITIFCGTFNG